MLSKIRFIAPALPVWDCESIRIVFLTLGVENFSPPPHNFTRSEKTMETLIVFLVVVGLLVWAKFSPDPLAEVIRVRAFGAKTRAEKALDSAKDRALRGKRVAEEKKAAANVQLIEIKKLRKRTEIDLEEARRKVTYFDTAAENAASVSRSDLVQAAETELQKWQEQVDLLEPTYNTIIGKEREVEEALEDLDKVISMRARQVREIDARSRTARTSGEVNRIIAGLNVDGTDDDMVKAFDLVKDAEADAGVWKEEADKVRAANKQRAEMDALARGKTNSVEDRVAARMAKYQKKSES
jgi:phage shock protein A